MDWGTKLEKRDLRFKKPFFEDLLSRLLGKSNFNRNKVFHWL